MADEKAKPWKKTEDIPRRFDELPPEPEWVPVADVIRTHREEEARQEAQKPKIKPPVDTDSDTSDTETKKEKEIKYEKAKPQEKNETRKKELPSRISGSSPAPPTVDDVTQSMLDWALNADRYLKKSPKHPTHQKKHTNPSPSIQDPSNLSHEKRHIGKETASNEQPRRIFKDYGPPRHGYDPRPDTYMPPAGYKTHTSPAGDPRMRTHQAVPYQRVQHPIQDEPSPDYDDDRYDEYYPRYDHENYREYYQDEYSYEARGSMEPYFDESPPYEDYPSYGPPQGYKDYPPEEFEPYEPHYLHEGHMRGYPQPSPYQHPMPHEDPREERHHSAYDVLY